MAFNKLKNLFNVDIKDGLKGSAVVQSSSMPTPQAQMYNVTMWLDVNVEGGAPYRVHHECMVKAGKHPWPGQTLPVMVDRENPERIDIQWKDLQTVDEHMAEGPGPVDRRAGRRTAQVIDMRGTDSPSSSGRAGGRAGARAGSGNMVEDRIASASGSRSCTREASSARRNSRRRRPGYWPVRRAAPRSPPTC